MKFQLTKTDPTQWQHSFAFFPKRVAEGNGHADYAWLENYEWRVIGGGYECYYYEARRIGATDVAKHTCYTD